MRAEDTTSGGTGGWLTDYRPLTVDISTLEEFAKAMREEHDANLMPHLDQVRHRLSGKIPFLDTRAFPEAHAAARRYVYALDTLHQRLGDIANRIDHLASTAETVARRYRGADQLAEARLKDVPDLLPPSNSQGGRL